MVGYTGVCGIWKCTLCEQRMHVRGVLKNPVEWWGRLGGAGSFSENPRVYRGRLDTAENVTAGR